MMMNVETPSIQEQRGAALSIADISLSFGGLAVLRHVNLPVTPGSTIGLVGPNGSGKTSLLNCINGVYAPDSGELRLDGELLNGLAPHRVERRGVARTFQHVEAPTDMSVADYIMLGRYSRMRRFGFAGYGLGFAWLLRYESPHRQICNAILNRLDFAHIAGERVTDVSYGTLKVVDLARALASEPRLLLLDEPAAGLNRSERVTLAGLLRTISGAGRTTICLIEHDMSFVASLCDHVAVLSSGEVLAYGDRESVMKREDVQEALIGSTNP